MANISPLLRQVMVAAAPQLAAFAVGGAITYPSVLLQQFKSNESTIHLDLDSGSWIGSIHGVTGLPSILIPLLMQWKGRKLAFIASCFISILGWLIAYTATSVEAILLSESFHGLGTHCLLAASLLSLSEMIAPKWRSRVMVSFYLIQSFGIASLGVMSRYLHWKTISLVMCSFMTLAFVIAFSWPESPSWLAFKGKFDECEKVFVSLRGSDKESEKELKELIAGQKVHSHSRSMNLKSVMSRDFYLPSLFMFVLMDLMYWSGGLVVLIYSSDIIKKATGNNELAAISGVIVNIILFVGITTTTILMKYFGNKTILLCSTLGVVIFSTSAALVTFLQSTGALPRDSVLCMYCLIAYMIAISLGINSIIFSMATELMPVKHRGLGGGLYVIFTCVLHSSSLKAAPYLFLCIGLSGTFLIYAVNAVICGMLIWRYIPETKGRTLQEIEDFYVDARFIKRNTESSVETSSFVRAPK